MMKRYALGILTGCVGLFGMVAASYGLLALAKPDSLPAPPITRLAALDEKLRFLRRHPDYDPAILAVGSSVAWRQLDGAPFDAAAGRAQAFLNGATVHLQMHQTRALLDFYLARYSNVRSVLLPIGLPDFDNCSQAPETLMPESAAAAYAFDEVPAAWFYMRFFAPQRFVRSAMSLAARQQPLTGDLHLDRWGSGPLDVPETMKRGLRYGDMRPDPTCIDALLQLAEDMRQRGLDLTVVIPPVHPDYRRRYPEAMAALCAIAARLSPLAGPSFSLLLRQDDPDYDAADFYDAFHLQYPAVRRLSDDIARAMHRIPAADALVASRSVAGLRDLSGPKRAETQVGTAPPRTASPGTASPGTSPSGGCETLT